MKKIEHGPGPLRGSRELIPFRRPAKFKPLDRKAGPIATSAFNRLGQYASNSGNRGYSATHVAELAVSFLAVAETIASTHCTYFGGMARLSRPGWLGYTPGWYTRERSPIQVLTRLMC